MGGGVTNAEETVTVVKFDDLARCVRCRRIVTPRRSLREGRCKCGGIKVAHPGMLDLPDLKEIELEYGWDIIIEGGQEGNYAEGLLQSGDRAPGRDGKGEAFGIDEARLHSRDAAARVRETNKQSKILVAKRWYADLPRAVLKALKRGDKTL